MKWWNMLYALLFERYHLLHIEKYHFYYFVHSKSFKNISLTVVIDEIWKNDDNFLKNISFSRWIYKGREDYQSRFLVNEKMQK